MKMYKHTNIKIPTYKSTSNRQLNNLINKNKVRRNLTNKIKQEKLTNKQNETNKTTKKQITLSKIKWENCQEKYWEKKHTSKTISKCKQKIQFQFLTLTIKTSLFSLAQMQHLQMWILKKTKTNVGKITFFKWQNLIRF